MHVEIARVRLGIVGAIQPWRNFEFHHFAFWFTLLMSGATRMAGCANPGDLCINW
jgi:hypothetical protein